MTTKAEWEAYQRLNVTTPGIPAVAKTESGRNLEAELAMEAAAKAKSARREGGGGGGSHGGHGG